MLADAFELRNFLEMSSKQLMKISFAKENWKWFSDKYPENGFHYTAECTVIVLCEALAIGDYQNEMEVWKWKHRIFGILKAVRE
jgi:hypothetical protein